MRRWLTFALLLALSGQSGALPRGGAANGGGGGAPAAPINVVIAQQGGTSNNVSNSQELTWTASSGATSYTVYRNGSSYATGVSCCTYTDSAATNSNVLATYSAETVYDYTVQACNGSGCSSGATPAVYFYQAGVSTQMCSTYSYSVTINCSSTTETYPGSTYSTQLVYSSGGWQPYANPALSPMWDVNVGGMAYAIWNQYLTDTAGTWVMAIHSRPGGDGGATNDIYSGIGLTIINGASSSYCGTITANTWLTCKVPLSSLGIGTGTFNGYVQSNWYGTGSLTGTTLTIASTLGGSTGNIAVGDILGAVGGSGATGPACMVVGSGSGTTWTVSYCSGQSSYTVPAGSTIYDAQVYVSSTTQAPAPDNGGMITGQSMPNGTFFIGPTSVSTHMGLTDGNLGAIPSAGSSGSPVAFGSQRISLYKPDYYPGENTTTYIDNFGWSTN